MTDGAARFAARYPLLFHVTERSSLASIRRNGLLPPTALCDLFQVSGNRRATLLDYNCDRYEPLDHPRHGSAILRRQLMRDDVMASRLLPGLTPTAWRRYINGLVFFMVDAGRAAGLRAYDKGRDQIVLVWQTHAMLGAGVELHTCRYNNGMVDRMPPDRRRLRSAKDYVPVSAYSDGYIAEVATATPVPASIRFTIRD